MKLLTALFCFFVMAATAQESSDSIADNGTEMNPDGSNKFRTPVGLDLMGGNTKGITIYPNQADDHVLISVAGKPSEKREITMTSLTGKQVYKTSNRRENTFMLDTSGLEKGIYVIQVISGNKVYRKKWAKRS